MSRKKFCSKSNRQPARLAIRARYRDVGEVAVEGRDRFAIAAMVVVLLLLAATVIVVVVR